MQVEALYDHGRLEFTRPLQLRHERLRLLVEVPDAELVSSMPVTYNLPPEVLAQAQAMRNRLDAIRNAKSSAEALAGAIGQKIGKCFYIYDSNYDVAPQYYDNMMMVRSKAMMADSAEAGAPEEPSLDFKTIKLEYNVQTKFVLE